MPKARLGKCEVCDKNDAKYCCPECEVKTCCLVCVNIHKKELHCSGIRNRVKFKKVKTFTNMDLQSDYRLLEEIGRSCEKFSKDRRVHNHSVLPKHLYRLKSAALRRNVDLHFLPRDFKRNKTNTTFLNFKTQELFWRLEWIFPLADGVKYVDERIVDSELLGNVLDRYINPLHNDEKRLKYYHAAGHSGVIVLLQAEKVPGERFYEMDVRSSVRENLSNKIIVEFPLLYVILKDHKQCYDIISPDEEEEIAEKMLQERNERQQKENPFINKFNDRNKKFSKNLLFPIDDDCNEVNENMNDIHVSDFNSLNLNDNNSDNGNVNFQTNSVGGTHYLNGSCSKSANDNSQSLFT